MGDGGAAAGDMKWLRFASDLSINPLLKTSSAMRKKLGANALDLLVVVLEWNERIQSVNQAGTLQN